MDLDSFGNVRFGIFTRKESRGFKSGYGRGQSNVPPSQRNVSFIYASKDPRLLHENVAAHHRTKSTLQVTSVTKTIYMQQRLNPPEVTIQYKIPCHFQLL